MNFLDQLQQAIEEFISKGNKREDCKLIMGDDFYKKFLEESSKKIGSKELTVTDFCQVEIFVSTYLPKKYCAVINYKMLSKDIYKPFVHKINFKRKGETK
jgi:hypothetical protein